MLVKLSLLAAQRWLSRYQLRTSRATIFAARPLVVDLPETENGLVAGVVLIELCSVLTDQSLYSAHMHPLPDELNLRNDMRDLIMQRPLSDLQLPRSVLPCTRLSSPRAGERPPLWSRSSLRDLAEALATRYAVEGSRV